MCSTCEKNGTANHSRMFNMKQYVTASTYLKLSKCTKISVYIYNPDLCMSFKKLSRFSAEYEFPPKSSMSCAEAIGLSCACSCALSSAQGIICDWSPFVLTVSLNGDSVRRVDFRRFNSSFLCRLKKPTCSTWRD